MSKEVKEREAHKSEFGKATLALFGTPEGRVWLKAAKSEYKYYAAASILGKGTDSGTNFHDGLKQIIRDIDKTLDNQ